MIIKSFWGSKSGRSTDLPSFELYPAGTIHEEELENMYIHSLIGPFSSKLTDLHVIRGTLNQVVGGGGTVRVTVPRRDLESQWEGT